MPTIKRIVCLANSRKLSGRCLAGRELVDGRPAGWIRPVSNREHEEVSEREREYENGKDPQVLDVIDVPLLEPRPKTFQSENWLLDADYYWKKVGRLEPADLENHVDNDGPLWLNANSTRAGLNDEIPIGHANGLTGSLTLVHVPALRIAVFSPGADFGNPKRRVQARFELGGDEYWLWITDPTYERRYLAQKDGEFALGDCYLTVSLGEPYGGYVYKLVAAIIEGTR
ncbi:MAG TPA: hypothetical protein VM942_05695 [Acidimicrobiales bacterium]|nr:hypothetical protein [Acidimicrobiales bacterium]